LTFGTNVLWAHGPVSYDSLTPQQHPPRNAAVIFTEYLEGRVNDYQQQVNLAAATREMPERYKGYSDLLSTMIRLVRR